MKIFVHNLEIYDCDILVGVGAKGEDFDKFLKTKVTNKEAKTLLNKDDIKELNETMDCAGFLMAVEHDKTKKQFYILWLKEYRNDWQDIEVLLHELVHLKQALFKDKRIADEGEHEAYFMESTFRSFRKRMAKELKL